MDRLLSAHAGRPQPAKAEPVTLDPAWPPQEALRLIVRKCVAQFRANTAGAEGPQPAEFLHQARVALRRLRSALRFVRPPDDSMAALQAEVKWLASYLGAARDWDVFISNMRSIASAYSASSAKPQMTRLLQAARRDRLKALKLAREALRSPRHEALLADLERWLEAAHSAELPAISLPEFAAREVGKLHEKLVRGSTGLAKRTPEERHRIRIRAKRLRYAIEFFGSLFATKPVKRYLRDLGALQDALGTVNDAATARRLITLLPRAHDAATFARGWIAAQEAASLGAAQTALESLAERRRFWKHAIPRRTQQ